MQKFIFALFIIAAIVAVPCNSVFANKIDGVSLNAQSTADVFNHMNHGGGFMFTTTPDNPGVGQNFWTLNNYGTDAPSTSAYHNNTIQSFSYNSFDAGYEWSGYIEYSSNGSQGHTTNDITWYMQMGTAYLYKMFATGEIDFSTGNYSQQDFFDKMYGFSFSGNSDLENMLLAINPDKDYWLSDYDPNAYYDEIGNYSVFYMYAYGPPDEGKRGPRFFIYIADAADPYAAQTPEPASMLLFGTGLLALPVARRFWHKKVNVAISLSSSSRKQ